MDWNEFWPLACACLIMLLFIALTVLTIRRKNLSLEQSLQELQANLTQASKIIDALPNSKYGTSFDQVMQYARVGVAQAEQLYKISQIERDARKEAARQFAHKSLSLAGVKCTPELESILNGCIESAVQQLGHGSAAGTAHPAKSVNTLCKKA